METQPVRATFQRLCFKECVGILTDSIVFDMIKKFDLVNKRFIFSYTAQQTDSSDVSAHVLIQQIKKNTPCLFNPRRFLNNVKGCLLMFW